MKFVRSIHRQLGFGGHHPPQPAPVPPDPVTEPKNIQAREESSINAIAERKISGRESTDVAGRQIAADEQYGVGLMAAKRMNAARRALGVS